MASRTVFAISLSSRLRVRSDDVRLPALEGWKQRATIAPPGGVPERPKGTGCKPVGSAYGGSNPPAPIIIIAIIDVLVAQLVGRDDGQFVAQLRLAEIDHAPLRALRRLLRQSPRPRRCRRHRRAPAAAPFRRGRTTPRAATAHRGRARGAAR